MTNKRIAQTNQQQKSQKPQASGILQRAAVRLVSDAGVQSIEDKEAQPLSNSVFSKDFSRVPISTTKPQQIMAKLMIGAVGDKYEQEADRVAAQVVQRINAPASVRSGEDESVQREEMETKDNKPRLMRSPILQRMYSNGGIATTPYLETSINQARSDGQSLADNIRKPMEQAFGADLSGVKVHTDTQADQLNQSIQAKAFTTGRDVFFRQGEYNPRSRGGQELIIHELTHVVQQCGSALTRTAGHSMIQRAPHPPELANTQGYEPITHSKKELYTLTEDYRINFNDGVYDLVFRDLTLHGGNELLATGLHGLTAQTRETVQLDHKPSWKDRRDKFIKYANEMTNRLQQNVLNNNDNSLIQQGYYIYDEKTRQYYPTMYGARKYYNDIDSLHPATPGANTSAGAQAVQTADVPGSFHYHADLAMVLTRLKFFHSELEKTLNQAGNEERGTFDPHPIANALKTYRKQLEQIEIQITASNIKKEQQD
ncbi:MAG: DUF4157 domain-containing protein [Nostoc sp.]|uniref:eCIS core domain-containing protein n=1 Tax=Nostoc sp. TaxID=1180 RepID=UPI002FEE8C8C